MAETRKPQKRPFVVRVNHNAKYFAWHHGKLSCSKMLSGAATFRTKDEAWSVVREHGCERDVTVCQIGEVA